jgi:cytochrome c553
VGITELYPTLAGQHPDYIVRALDEYQKGARKNPIMTTFVRNMTPEQMNALADYFSKQTPALETEPRTLTRFSAPE